MTSLSVARDFEDKQEVDEEIPVLVPTIYENEDGKTVHEDAEEMVEP